MAGVHRLEHVERFFAAALSDDDAVGTHTQSVDQQLALAHRPLAFEVGRPRLEPYHVRLLELQFGGVFDGHDTLFRRDERRQGVEHRRLARTGSARHHDVQPRLHHGFEQLHHPFGEGEARHQIVRHQLVGAETADRQQRPVDREWGNNGVNARAVGEACVHHRGGLVDAAAHLRDDLVDDAQQVAVILKRNVGQLQLALSLHVDLFVGVDQDVAHGRVLQQRLERTEAEDLVEHLVADLLALDRTEQRRLFVNQRHQRVPHFRTHLLVFDRGQRFEVDLVEQTPVELELQLLVVGIERQAGARSTTPDAVFPTVGSRLQLL